MTFLHAFYSLMHTHQGKTREQLIIGLCVLTRSHTHMHTAEGGSTPTLPIRLYLYDLLWGAVTCKNMTREMNEHKHVRFIMNTSDSLSLEMKQRS